MAFSCGLALVILSLVFVPVKGAQPNPCGENFLAVASTGEIRRSYLNIVNRRLSTTLCRKPLLDCFREKYLACAPHGTSQVYNDWLVDRLVRLVTNRRVNEQRICILRLAVPSMDVSKNVNFRLDPANDWHKLLA